ncbi:MAG: hypothetical protein JWO42_1383, partial [Chloroflexi bacterium]|nr:hypothetical protein [Chloroflexota bacterium]
MARSSGIWRYVLVATMLIAVASTVAIAGYTNAGAAAQGPARCKALNGPKDLKAAGTATIDTVEQGYQ